MIIKLNRPWVLSNATADIGKRGVYAPAGAYEVQQAGNPFALEAYGANCPWLVFLNAHEVFKMDPPLTSSAIVGLAERVFRDSVHGGERHRRAQAVFRFTQIPPKERDQEARCYAAIWQSCWGGLPDDHVVTFH